MLAVTSANPSTTSDGCATPIEMRSARASAAARSGTSRQTRTNRSGFTCATTSRGTCDRTEPGGDRFEELGTGLVAEPFVDLGEVVELDRHHGNASEGDLAIGEPPAQALEVEDRDPRLTGIPVAARGRGTGSATRSGDGSVDSGGAAANTAASVIGAGGMPGSSESRRADHVDRRSARPSRPGSSTSTTGSRSWATRSAARRARRLARERDDGRTDGHRGRDDPDGDEQHVVHVQLSEVAAPTLSRRGPAKADGAIRRLRGDAEWPPRRAARLLRRRCSVRSRAITSCLLGSTSNGHRVTTCDAIRVTLMGCRWDTARGLGEPAEKLCARDSRQAGRKRCRLPVMERRLLIARVGSCFALVLLSVLALTSMAAGWLKVVMIVGGLLSVACAFAAKPSAEPST